MNQLKARPAGCCSRQPAGRRLPSGASLMAKKTPRDDGTDLVHVDAYGNAWANLTPADFQPTDPPCQRDPLGLVRDECRKALTKLRDDRRGLAERAVILHELW